MAREIKKPAKVREADLKDYAGDVVIDVTPGKEKPKAAQKSVPQDAVAEQIQVAEAQAAAQPDVRLVSFNAWFQKATAKNPRVKLSYKEAIEAHCKAVGLPSQATEEAFDAALSHFGL
jgi:hypothetical protein